MGLAPIWLFWEVVSYFFPLNLRNFNRGELDSFIRIVITDKFGHTSAFWFFIFNVFFALYGDWEVYFLVFSLVSSLLEDNLFLILQFEKASQIVCHLNCFSALYCVRWPFTAFSGDLNSPLAILFSVFISFTFLFYPIIFFTLAASFIMAFCTFFIKGFLDSLEDIKEFSNTFCWLLW